ncbi:MAG: hypothetical protein OER97_04765 [Gammaproteobacteria bacterium]|nr:hypothetical protein [Gammaproteobacteria bacterium]
MTHTNWREIAEVVGIVSIVASLLLLAMELRQSNRIARAEVELELAATYRDIHAARYTDADFAQLFPKIEAPQAHLITATDNSRMQALAWNLANVYWSAQIAFDKGLLDQAALARYQHDVDITLQRWPGLQQHFVDFYESSPHLEGARVFEPIAALARKSRENQPQ